MRTIKVEVNGYNTYVTVDPPFESIIGNTERSAEDQFVLDLVDEIAAQGRSDTAIFRALGHVGNRGPVE